MISLNTYNRVLVDVTSSSSIRWNTGVQRVARGLCLAIVRAKDEKFGFRGSIFYDNELRSYKHMPRALEWIGLPANCRNWPIFKFYFKWFSKSVDFSAGDFVMLVDVCWHYGNADVLLRGKQNGATFFWLLYDIIPLRFPGQTEPNNENRLREWVTESLDFLDYVCGISNAVSNDYLAYLKEVHKEIKIPEVFSTSLAPSVKHKRRFLPVLKKSNEKYILCVGTVEPRKNYTYIIEAFEQLWASSNDNLSLKIVGTIGGWGGEEVFANITQSQFFGTRFEVLTDVSDRELRKLYRGASGLLSASKAEGFGLPIIEAKSFGIDLMLSNIPAHREVGGDSATYFDLANVYELSEILQSFSPSGVKPHNTELSDSWHMTYSSIMSRI